MEGWLKKKGENLGALFWKDRWFKEEDGFLHYYTTSSGSTPKGSIDIKLIKDARPRADNFGQSSGFGFEIEVDGRIYCLMAAREAEQLAWVNGILARIDKKKKFVISDDEWIQSLGEVARSAVIRITNNSKHTLKREGFKLHGAGQVWKKFPPEELAPGASAVFGSCSSTLLTGTAASVTYKTMANYDETIIWMRWENPLGKVLTSGRKALSEAPSGFKIETTIDTSQSSKSIADSDIYKVSYTINEIGENLGKGSSSSSSNSRAQNDGTHTHKNIGAISDAKSDDMEEDWIDLEKSSVGPTTTDDGRGGQVVNTSFGATYYHADWIPSLKESARSVLVTIINETSFECKRSDWSLTRGLWRAIPSETIDAKTTVRFGTASHGVFGFRSGTIGSVTYILRVDSGPGTTGSKSKATSSAPSSTTDYIITFEWRNHAVRGIGNNVSLTVTSSTSSSLPPSLISVLTESNNRPACELTFKIVDQSIQDKAKTTADSSANKSESAAVTTTKTTITMRPQEDGVTKSLTSDFMSARRDKTKVLKAKLLSTENDLELASKAVIDQAKALEERSIIDSFFSKGASHLERAAECVSPTCTPAPMTTPECPLTHIKFKSNDEKRYCLVCGRIVHQSATAVVPFPPASALSLLDLKKKPAGVKVCVECNDTLSKAERPHAWKRTLAAAQENPVHVIHSGLVSNRMEVKRALQDLRKMKIAKDKRCDLVVAKIETLLKNIDDLQMRLFGLNEEATRAEQKLNNTIALLVTDWKDEILPELEALKSE